MDIKYLFKYLSRRWPFTFGLTAIIVGFIYFGVTGPNVSDLIAFWLIFGLVMSFVPDSFIDPRLLFPNHSANKSYVLSTVFFCTTFVIAVTIIISAYNAFIGRIV